MTTQESIDKLVDVVASDIASRQHQPREPKSSPVLLWIGGIAATVIGALLVAVLLGSYSMMQKASVEIRLAAQEREFVTEKLDEIKTDMTQLKAKLDFGTADRWTKSNQKDFSQDIDDRFDELKDDIEDRLDDGEATHKRLWDAINSKAGIHTGEVKTN